MVTTPLNSSERAVLQFLENSIMWIKAGVMTVTDNRRRSTWLIYDERVCGIVDVVLFQAIREVVKS